MTSKNLSCKLIKFFPTLEDGYMELINDYDGDFPGNHIIMGDIFNPWLINTLADKSNVSDIKKAIIFMNKMAYSTDDSVVNVLIVTVLERVGDFPELLSYLKKFLCYKAIKLCNENELSWGRLHNVDNEYINEQEKESK